MNFIFRKPFLLQLSIMFSALVGLGLITIAKAETSQVTTNPIVLDVYKDPNCGCCNAWIDHANERGFTANPHNIGGLYEFKLSKGVSGSYQSCHTAISTEGYVFEGHIPAKFIHAFLAAPPANAIGLSVPAMPVGSPGMEYKNMFRPYQILQINADGSTEIFAQVNTLEESVE